MASRNICRFLFIAELALLALPLSLIAAVAQAKLQPIPSLSARVTDLTGTLDTSQRQSLESKLAALERRKGSQIGVLIVPTTQPEDIAQYAIRVFDAWKLGRRGIDDGVLLIAAKDDHRVRIEVARGLEGAIPDAAADRIIREYVTPKFRVGDFYGGIEAATGMLIQLIDGEPLPPPRKTWDGIGDTFILILSLFFMVSLLIWLVNAYGKGSRNERSVRILYLFRFATTVLICAIVAVSGLLVFRWFGWQALAAMAGVVLLAVFAKPLGLIVVRDTGSGLGSDSSAGSSNDSSSSSNDSSFSGGGGESAGGGASGNW